MKTPPRGHRDAEYVEEVARHDRAACPFGRAVTKREVDVVKRGDAREELASFPQGHEARIGKASRACRVFDFHRQPDEAVGPDRRRRSEQERVEDAEHGRVGADAQRERQNGGGCPGRASKQLPEAVPKILEQPIGGEPSPGFFACFTKHGGIAERSPRREIGFLLVHPKLAIRARPQLDMQT